MTAIFFCDSQNKMKNTFPCVKSAQKKKHGYHLLFTPIGPFWHKNGDISYFDELARSSLSSQIKREREVDVKFKLVASNKIPFNLKTNQGNHLIFFLISS